MITIQKPFNPHQKANPIGKTQQITHPFNPTLKKLKKTEISKVLK